MIINSCCNLHFQVSFLLVYPFSSVIVNHRPRFATPWILSKLLPEAPSFVYVLRCQVYWRFKGYVHYFFASLFCKPKGEHLWNNEKCFLFHFKSSFHSSDNQILAFQIFKCYDVIKYPSMKHQAHFTENLENKHNLVMKLC